MGMTGQQEGLASPWYPSFFDSDNCKLAEMKRFYVLLFANVLSPK
jgi:hypothetical protein